MGLEGQISPNCLQVLFPITAFACHPPTGSAAITSESGVECIYEGLRYSFLDAIPICLIYSN